MPQPARQDPAILPRFHFQGLSRWKGLRHAVFTRLGGVSPPPFFSLNVSCGAGDQPGHVLENLSRIRESMGGRELVFMNQVHGKESLLLRSGSAGCPPGSDGDALITDRDDIALMVKQADCQGVVLYEPVARVVAVVHCGWRGSVLNILGSVVRRMVSEFPCSRDRILAAVGPSLGPCCAEFTTHREIFPEGFRSFMVRENHFDLWGVSRSQLLEAGLRDGNIEIAGVCTRCRTDLYFSYRAERLTGRFATVAMLV